MDDPNDIESGEEPSNGKVSWTVGKAARFASIGFEFTMPPIAGAVGGHYADQYFHTDPWITFVMFMSGLVLGFTRLIIDLKLANKSLNE